MNRWNYFGTMFWVGCVILLFLPDAFKNISLLIGIFIFMVLLAIGEKLSEILKELQKR